MAIGAFDAVDFMLDEEVDEGYKEGVKEGRGVSPVRLKSANYMRPGMELQDTSLPPFNGL